MIPNNDNYDDEVQDEVISDFDVTVDPSLTYGMDLNNYTFVGKVGTDSGIESIKQAVVKILNTERYTSEIYTWDYGVELQDLIGKPMPYVMSELKSRISDALTMDDRIQDVTDFKFERLGKDTLRCAFTVITAQGDEFEAGTEVNI